MDSRTKRLYIVVPLLWILLMSLAVWVAHARTGAEGGVEEEEESKEGEKQSLAPLTVPPLALSQAVEAKRARPGAALVDADTVQAHSASDIAIGVEGGATHSFTGPWASATVSRTSWVRRSTV